MTPEIYCHHLLRWKKKKKVKINIKSWRDQVLRREEFLRQYGDVQWPAVSNTGSRLSALATPPPPGTAGSVRAERLRWCRSSGSLCQGHETLATQFPFSTQLRGKKKGREKKTVVRFRQEIQSLAVRSVALRVSSFRCAYLSLVDDYRFLVRFGTFVSEFCCQCRRLCWLRADIRTVFWYFLSPLSLINIETVPAATLGTSSPVYVCVRACQPRRAHSVCVCVCVQKGSPIAGFRHYKQSAGVKCLSFRAGHWRANVQLVYRLVPAGPLKPRPSPGDWQLLQFGFAA